MIQIKANKDCCGCSACVQVCPKQCITMIEDQEGFLYPDTNTKTCIDCGLCEKVCPVIIQGKEHQPLFVYGAKNKEEEVRRQSSSGGIFSLLAEHVINKGGVVFGVCFNKDWEIIHDYTETIEGLAAFRGSKYVQSRIGNTYIQAEHFLKQGRFVLFSGTPCQIAGLKLYLRKDYKDLLTVDFVCHGVPSPMVWKKYLKEQLRCKNVGKNSIFSHSKPVFLNSTRSVSRIEFRNKSLGWKKFSFTLTLTMPEGHEKNSVLVSESLTENIFLRGFLNNLYLRPSCYSCSSRSFKSGSDITLADFWTIGRYHPEIKDDNKGISLILTTTPLGYDQILSLRNYMDCWPSTFNVACIVNPSIYKNAVPHKYRNIFFKELSTADSVSLLIKKMIRKPIRVRLVSLTKRVINQFLFILKKR